ncbi:dihydrofolate reductase family protein [Kamptonema sp. UHCC 0994]|uniref:dihydrofolate reductase family protein n=1 Tax=Kamptonema sp. UHCC 0994 TaxID=3031329 RepID=UPI0023B89875|nr:dihydrofolate reductase family protein [Kamptonema sp. UHCC 0994]MDF0552318.1 dihydrofolate reductase family protein [Kamptonema sp. UHCC 0994]
MRPFTFINLAISIDGKISTFDRKLQAFGGIEDQELMEDLRAKADAIMIGGQTMRDEDILLTVRSPERIAQRLAANRDRQPWSVVVSQSLNLTTENSQFFQSQNSRKLLFTSELQSKNRREEFSKFAEVYTVPETTQGLDLAALCNHIHLMGVRQLLLEGGGVLNFSMLAAKLVDEIYLTVCPYIFGGYDSPSAVSGKGFPANEFPELELLNSRFGLNDRLFLHYRCR